ncbi:MAG: hypothetical protein ABR502_06650 [Chitinophagaceae bacterium]
MSLENAKQLVQQLSVNEYLRDEFLQRKSAGFETVAAEKGSPCTKEEFKIAIKQQKKLLLELIE